MKEMWDTRYSNDSYAYGIAPNEFLKEVMNREVITGKILFPAEGEGRNAVYAAKKGLEVHAFDISLEGRKKALKLAKKENVCINYEVGDFFELDLIHHQFDAAALIYAHFPPAILSSYHQKIGSLIKPGGLIILEGFSVGNLEMKKENPNIGGPDNAALLFSIETIQKDFNDFEIIQLEEVEVALKEGDFHNGNGKVIRFVGKKNY